MNNRADNRVILDIQTYQDISDRIKELETHNCEEEILMLNRKIKILENQKAVLIEQIKAQDKWHNLFYYEHALRSKYEKTLRRISSLSLSGRIFKYKKIINSVIKSQALFSKEFENA